MRFAVLQVLTLSQILRFDVDTSVTERLRLESLAQMALTYKFQDGAKVAADLQYYAGPEYKVPVHVLAHPIIFSMVLFLLAMLHVKFLQRCYKRMCQCVV